MAGSHFFLGGAMFTALLLLGLASSQTGWYDAHATFYGDMQGNETMRMLVFCINENLACLSPNYAHET